MSAKKCWMASTQTDVGSFLFPSSCLSSFNFTPRCKGQEEAAGVRRSCLCRSCRPAGTIGPKSSFSCFLCCCLSSLSRSRAPTGPAGAEFCFLTEHRVPKMCSASALPKSSLVGLCCSQPPYQGDGCATGDRFPVLGPYHNTACPGFPLRGHLPPAAVGFLSAVFLSAERPRANAQPSGGKKLAHPPLPAASHGAGARPRRAHRGFFGRWGP